MHSFLSLLRLELQRRLRDPLSLFAWLAIPFLMVILMIAVFGPKSGGLPQVKMLLVDRDDSMLSRFLGSALDSPQVGEFLEVETVDQEEAHNLLQAGKVSVVLEIPEGFQEDYLDNKPVSLTVFRNPQEDILPSIGEDVVRFLADGGTMLRAVLHPLFESTNVSFDEEPGVEQVSELSARIHKLVNNPAAENLISQDALEIDTERNDSRQVTRSEIIGWFAPGLVAMALLFLCNGLSQEIQEDLSEGRLARAWSFPTAPSITVLVKAGALILSATAIALALIGCFAAFLGWRPGNVPLLVVHVFASAAAFTGLAMFLRSFTRNPEAGGAAASGIMVGLGFLGGCFMPVVFLPKFLQTASDLIPTGWAVQAMHVMQGAEWAEAGDGVIWRTAALLATAVITLWVSNRLMLRKAVAK
jgi:ABC-2 type transport system permease protein